MAADSSTSAQRRRATKPLIEKRRRARINSSLAQLKEMVAKSSNNSQETRSNRLEKADILEMTVEYVKRIHGRQKLTDFRKDTAVALEPSQTFKEGYRLCMSEVQNFFSKNYQKQASKEFLGRSLQNYLQRVFQKNLVREDQTLQNKTCNEFDNSKSLPIDDCHRTGCNSDMKKSEYYDFHSESSDLGCNYSSTSTDDEMIENNSASESTDNNRPKVSCFLSDDFFSKEDSYHGVNHNVSASDKMWRPW